MAIIQNNQLILKLGPAEGDHLKAIQEAFIFAIETLARSEYAQDDYCQDAVTILSDLLRQSLLDQDQMKLRGFKLCDHPESNEPLS